MKSNNNSEDGNLTIGRLAEAGEVGVSTIRYYQKRGLLSEPPKPKHGGFRVYDDRALERLLQIRNAQSFGFTLKEIGLILSYRECGDCGSARALIADREQAIKKQIRTLTKTQKTIRDLSTVCTGKCNGSGCPLFQKLGSRNLE